jgi:GntR family transcriptional regulator
MAGSSGRGRTVGVISPDLTERLRSGLAARNSEPLHVSLRDEIARAIRERAVRPGSRLPSERSLAEALDISRVTLRKALDALCDEGLLLRQQGARTVVVHRLEKAVSRLTGFSDDMRARGREPGALWIERTVGPPSRAEAAALKLSESAKVVRLVRVRTADGEPVAVERATLPQALLHDPELVGQSLYAALDKLGVRPVRGVQKMRAVAARPPEARLLGCDTGTPLFCVERRCFDLKGTCVAFTETHYLGTAYDFVTDLIE